MSSSPIAAVILAAGQGKRMRAPVPKVLVQVCGCAMVEHVLAAVQPLETSPTVIVYGHGGAQVQQALAGRSLAFAHQAEQRGTGHAVQSALGALDGFAGDVLVLCGDTPLLTTQVLDALIADHRGHGRALTVLSARLREPGSLGRILRGADGTLAEIREVADASDAERAVDEINTGVMVIASEHLRGALERLTPDNAQGEYYLTDVPRLLLADGHAVDAYKTLDEGAALGVNNPVELAEAAAVLRRRYLDALLTDGVRIDDPETTRIDAGVEVGAQTRLLPHTHLGRGVRIGAGCTIGPHSHLHGGVVIDDGAVVGGHTDLADCRVEAGAHVAGPARLAGAAIGRGARLGPGVVTDGEERGRVVVGDEAYIGAGCVLLAPVTVGEGTHVEAGSVLGGDRNG